VGLFSHVRHAHSPLSIRLRDDPSGRNDAFPKGCHSDRERTSHIHRAGSVLVLYSTFLLHVLYLFSV